MTDKQIIIDGEHDMNYCEDNNCKHYDNKEECEKTHCYYRCYSKLYTALKRKEQECEELKKYLHKNFEEKDKLHLIIDRLLEASGYDTNTASAEDFEDVYENMRYEKQQLDQLKQTLAEIKEVAKWHTTNADSEDIQEDMKQILQKISECEVENER